MIIYPNETYPRIGIKGQFKVGWLVKTVIYKVSEQKKLMKVNVDMWSVSDWVTVDTKAWCV